MTLTVDFVEAEDRNRLWYFGGNLSFHTTTDSIESNAGLRNDPRPGDFADRETTVEDSLAGGLTIGYGLTSWFSLQLDAGYSEGEVGPIQTYLIDRFPVADPPSMINVSRMKERETTIPVVAGELRESPVSLSGIFRFRRDRPVNPFIGAGLGMILTEFKASPELPAMNDRLSKLRIQAILDEDGREITPERFKHLKGQGRVPMLHLASVEVSNSPEFHLTAGIEYARSDRVSIVAEARYLLANREMIIDLAGENQVNLLIWSENLFRPDGSLKFFRMRGGFPNTLKDPNDVGQGTFVCTLNTRSDFDNDGHSDDLCYEDDAFDKEDDPVGTFVVQGGRVNLSGFTVSLGIRFFF